MSEFSIELPKDKKSVWDEYVPIVRKAREIDVYLTDAIDVPATYNELLATINEAMVGDTVNLYINNGGGAIDSAFMLADAMTKCEAHIVGHLSGTVASAATMLTMYCDEIRVAPFIQFMVHNYSHGTSGTGSQVKEYVNFADRELVAAIKVIYAGFLTEEEMASISEDDKEIWLNTQEVEDRWVKKQLHDLGMNSADVVNSLAKGCSDED